MEHGPLVETFGWFSSLRNTKKKNSQMTKRRRNKFWSIQPRTTSVVRIWFYLFLFLFLGGIDMLTMTGLNVREPFATLLACGLKTVETRRYKPPSHLIGQRIAIIQTGVEKSMIIGHAVLTDWQQYGSKKQWNDDRKNHLVAPGSDFDWDDDSARYAWKMERAVMLKKPVQPPAKRGRIYAKHCTVKGGEK
jgi:predicted transcriptional regulator